MPFFVDPSIEGKMLNRNQSKQSKEIATDDNTQLTTASSVHALTLVTAKHQAVSQLQRPETWDAESA